MSARFVTQKYVSRTFITFPQRWEVSCEKRSSTDTSEKSSTKLARTNSKRSCSQSKPIIKSVDLKDNIIKTSAKLQDKRNHITTIHDQVKTRVPKIDLMVLETFKISQSPDNHASSNQLEHLKKMGISKSHDDLGV